LKDWTLSVGRSSCLHAWNPTPPSLARQFYRRQSKSHRSGAKARGFLLFAATGRDETALIKKKREAFIAGRSKIFEKGERPTPNSEKQRYVISNAFGYLINTGLQTGVSRW